MLPAKGFLHFIPLQRQRVAFFDARQHSGVDGMHMQHHVGFREQAIHRVCRPVSADGFRPEGARLVAISTCRKSSVVRLPLSRPDSLSQHRVSS